MGLESAMLASRCFEEFYIKLIGMQGQFSNGEDLNAIEFIQSELISIFDLQLSRMSNNKEFFVKQRYLCVQYIMVAFADEFFITLNQNRNNHWLDRLLERSIFHTHISGDKIFTDIEKILEEKDDHELAEVYLLVLNLGFKGKYIDTPKYLVKLKVQLFNMIHRMTHKIDLPMIFGPLETISAPYALSCDRYENAYSIKLWILTMIIYFGSLYVIWQLYIDPLYILLDTCGVA
jgi:type IV/VI secretion system ImpK/VasF family protein